MLSTVHLLKETEVTVPRPLPGSPLPDLSEPVSFDDVQDSEMFDVVSFSVVVPAFPVMAPPGQTDQVAAVAAGDDAAPSPIVRAAAPAAKIVAAMRCASGQFLHDPSAGTVRNSGPAAEDRLNTRCV